MRNFRVIVPFKRRGKLRAVSYPASGCDLYTRLEAIAVLKRFATRHPERGIDASPLCCYAEGPHERFTLEDIDRN